MEGIVGILGVVVSIVTYFFGRRDGTRAEKRRQAHEKQLEDERTLRSSISRVVDEYVDMHRRAHDSGPHALAGLGLELLGADEPIREAIRQMEARTSHDPWSGTSADIENVDLVAFFRVVRQERINFFNVSVKDVAARVLAAGGVRGSAT